MFISYFYSGHAKDCLTVAPDAIYDLFLLLVEKIEEWGIFEQDSAFSFLLPRKGQGHSVFAFLLVRFIPK